MKKYIVLFFAFSIQASFADTAANFLKNSIPSEGTHHLPAHQDSKSNVLCSHIYLESTTNNISMFFRDPNTSQWAKIQITGSSVSVLPSMKASSTIRYFSESKRSVQISKSLLKGNRLIVSSEAELVEDYDSLSTGVRRNFTTTLWTSRSSGKVDRIKIESKSNSGLDHKVHLECKLQG